VNSWKIILATIVIFGAGVMAGGLLVSHVDRSNRNARHWPGAPESRPPGNTNRAQLAHMRPPELFGRESKDFMRQLDESLKLTPGQHDTIQEIIAEGQEQMQKAVQSVRQDTHRKVRDQLTPDQQKQFDELMRRPSQHHGMTNAPLAFPPGFTNGPPGGVPASTNAPGA
jgi:hypothetical protein